MQPALKHLWERYLETSSESSELLKFLDANPQATHSCEHQHPYLHRIQDVDLNGCAFRVLRCVLCNEDLYFEPLDSRAIDVEAVPYRLRGVV